jgi:hypothetical protein
MPVIFPPGRLKLATKPNLIGARQVRNALKMKEPQQAVVVDAVGCEPASASKFPANRENNREF